MSVMSSVVPYPNVSPLARFCHSFDDVHLDVRSSGFCELGNSLSLTEMPSAFVVVPVTMVVNVFSTFQVSCRPLIH